MSCPKMEKKLIFPLKWLRWRFLLHSPMGWTPLGWRLTGSFLHLRCLGQVSRQRSYGCDVEDRWHSASGDGKVYLQREKWGNRGSALRQRVSCWLPVRTACLVCVYVCVCARARVCVCLCVCICMDYECMYVCVHASMYVSDCSV